MNKEKLKDMLKKYKDILNKSMIEYLKSLLELEFSIINNYISDNERLMLSELEIYKEIANYNIYNRAYNLINKEKEFNIINKTNDDNLSIYADINGNSIILFNYIFIGSDNYSDRENGYISLYKTINSIEQKEKEINRLTSILDVLYNEKNPYHHVNNVYGGPSSKWAINHNNKIKQYEDRLSKIEDKNELTDNDKKEIEITNKIHNLLLNDYNLNDDDFVINNFRNRHHEETELYKTYIKQMPKINIKNNIKYI